MISRVQNYQTKPAIVTFKAKENSNIDSNKDSQNAIYKTNAGLKTSVGYIGYQSLFFLNSQVVAKNIKKHSAIPIGNELDAISVKGVEKYLNLLEVMTKYTKYKFPVSILIGIGCGALVDKKINEKHAQMAGKLASEGKKAVLEQEDRAELSKKGNVFYKSNVGKTFGVALGAVVLPVASLITGKITKSPILVKNLVSSAITGTIGGLILGSITDKVSNKGAAKFADKQNAEV